MESVSQPDEDVRPIGSVFNVMRFAVNDGPGIRTTVFLKGCPLLCLWCHNPESQKLTPELMFAEERCIACGDCVSACPHQALGWKDGRPVRAEKCELCGECCDACPTDTRRMVGRRTTVKDLLRLILRDRIIYEESGGGVTFSGGEPLMQPEFLRAMLAACQSEGIHTAVDTCGYASAKSFSRIAELADLFLFDLKLMDRELHERFTGRGNGLVLENLRTAVHLGKQVRVRIPIVPGINDDEQNLGATMEFLASLKIQSVDLLPYHSTGTEKYRRLESANPAEIVPPTEAHMNSLRERFVARGFVVRIGG